MLFLRFKNDKMHHYTAISGLFGNLMLVKYWTEHMLGYFDPAGWVKCLNQHAGLLYLTQLLFKNDYIAGLKHPWKKVIWQM